MSLDDIRRTVTQKALAPIVQEIQDLFEKLRLRGTPRLLTGGDTEEP